MPLVTLRHHVTSGVDLGWLWSRPSHLAGSVGSLYASNHAWAACHHGGRLGVGFGVVQGRTWGRPGHLASSVPGQKQQCRWWVEGQQGLQQRLTGRQCPGTAPAGLPTSSQVAVGRWRRGSPPGGPTAPTARGADLQLQPATTQHQVIEGRMTFVISGECASVAWVASGIF